MKTQIVLAAVLAALNGCALVPATVTPEFVHISHATQHEPFTDHPTRYGANIADVALGWNLAPHVTLTLAEGVSLDRHYPWMPGYGEIVGPREQFTGRIGYTFNTGH